MALEKYAYYLKSVFVILTQFDQPGWLLRIFLGLGGKNIKQVRLKDSQLSFFVRSPMDIWCLKETFLDRFYEHAGTPLQDGWTVVDIGAGLGDFAILAAHGFPNNQVFAYEPFMESFTLLNRNLAANQICNVQVFQQAVGQTGSQVLDLSGDEPLQIQSRQAQPGQVEKGERTVEVTSLALNEVFVQNGIRRCDLLKLDCEGAEYEILLNARPEALERVQRLVMEYHDGVQGRSYQDLVRFLEGQGFRVTTTPNLVHPNLGYLYAARP